MQEKFFVEINGLKYKVNSNYTILQTCLKLGIEIPRYCYHAQLNIAGNCRMCLVEVLYPMVTKPVVSCAYRIVPNMIITTQSMLLKKARRTVIEFLLINHPLDCGICDRAAECDLQDEAYIYGSLRGRYYNSRRGVFDKFNSLFIKTIMTRCIHCTRCIRFLSEIQDTKNLLGMVGRGNDMKITSFITRLQTQYLFELSGNIIDLCPVGALTSKVYAFKGKSPELEVITTIDILDSLFTNINIEFDLKSLKILRVLPRLQTDIKQDWITNKVRFFYDALNKERLLYPQFNLKNYYFFRYNLVNENKNLYFFRSINYTDFFIDSYKYKKGYYYDFNHLLEYYLNYLNLEQFLQGMNVKNIYFIYILSYLKLYLNVLNDFIFNSIEYNFVLDDFDFIVYNESENLDQQDNNIIETYKKREEKVGFLRNLTNYLLKGINDIFFSNNLYILMILNFIIYVFRTYKLEFKIYIYFLRNIENILITEFFINKDENKFSHILNEVKFSLFHQLFYDFFCISDVKVEEEKEKDVDNQEIPKTFEQIKQEKIQEFILKNFLQMIINFYYYFSSEVYLDTNVFIIKELETEFLKINLDWFCLMKFIKSFLPQYSLNNTNFNFLFFTGALVDLENLLYIKEITNLLGFTDIRVYNLQNFFNFDLRFCSYFNFNLEKLELIDLYLIFFFNLRLEYPLLYVKIKKLNNLNKNKIIFFGSYHDDLIFFNNNYNLGSNVKSLYNFLQGKLFISTIFIESLNPLFLLSIDNLIYLNIKYNYFVYLIYNFCVSQLIVYQETLSLNILSRVSTYGNISELEIGNSIYLNTTSIYLNTINYLFFYMIHYDDFNYYLILKSFKLLNCFNSFFLFQGGNNSMFSELADLVLPSKFLYEQKGLFINLNREIKFKKKIFSEQHIFLIRSDLNILYLFSSQLCKTYLTIYKRYNIEEQKSFPYQFVSEIRNRLCIISPELYYFFRYDVKAIIDDERHIDIVYHNFSGWCADKMIVYIPYIICLIQMVNYFEFKTFGIPTNMNCFNLYNNYYIADSLTNASYNLSLASFEYYKNYLNFLET